MEYSSTPIVNKLKNLADKAIGQGRYEKALAAIAAAAKLLYAHNQYYTDDTLEQMVRRIEAVALGQKPAVFPPCNDSSTKTVLFYDGFGLDTRGLALIFVKALAKIGYRVIYVTVPTARGTQPRIHEAVEGCDVQWVYLPAGGHVNRMRSICQAFNTYQPQAAFFYTQPDDVAATVAFCHYEELTTRYQIDLTDHAFWLGISAFDYCVALRDVGAKIAYHYRGVRDENIRMLPYYATVNYDAPFQGFPFPTEGRRVIFSGGALYKTLGDPDNTYYKMAEALLRNHEDLVFVYAGYGDDSQLKLLQSKFPDRVHHIAERSDLYQVLRNSVLYLNTYPMFGGLMMNYAATAGRLPLTLKHGHDADGLLFDQANLGIEYDTTEELLADADRLLTDSDYLQQRESRLAQSVITEVRFQSNLQQLVETSRTEFPFSLDAIDTTQFRQEYDHRFRLKEATRRAIASKANLALAGSFPGLFACAFFVKLKNKFFPKGK